MTSRKKKMFGPRSTSSTHQVQQTDSGGDHLRARVKGYRYCTGRGKGVVSL